MSHDTWLHKIARFTIVRPLVPTRVTPNHLTTVRIIAGVSAAVALGTGQPGWSAVGAGLFILSMLLDRADGDLARLTGRTSPGGHAYDLFADTLCNALIFLGLGIGLRGSDFGFWAMLFVPLAILIGWNEGLLIAATIGAPVFALLFAVLFRKALRAGAASGPA